MPQKIEKYQKKHIQDICSENMISDNRLSVILVEGQCQSGKTSSVNKILKDKIKKDSDTLLLYCTQASCVSATLQTISRSKEDLNTILDVKNILRSKEAVKIVRENVKQNYMVVDFWHNSNRANMLNVAVMFRNIVIIFDEAEHGGYNSVKERLKFIQSIEHIETIKNITIMFVTATSPNLSKCILEASLDSQLIQQTESIVGKLINDNIVEYHHVHPASNYIGTEKLITNDIKYLNFPEKSKKTTTKDYENIQRDIICKQIEKLNYEDKKLTMIATSIKMDYHEDMAHMILNDIGFNVAIIMNSSNIKNYKLLYKPDNCKNDIQYWNIPYSEMIKLADTDSLSMIKIDGKIIDTNIKNKEHISLPEILQSAIFMGTYYEDKIKEKIEYKKFLKLYTINNAMCTLVKKKRPNNFPKEPRTALIVGSLANRGITFQDESIDLLCTSFVFSESKDNDQRGAITTQRFGRACGNFNKLPKIISTREVIQAAITNTKAVTHKASEICTGEKICLKQYITEKEWYDIKDKVSKSLIVKDNRPGPSRVKSFDIEKIQNQIDKRSVIGVILGYLLKHVPNGEKIKLDKLQKNIDYKGDNFESNISNGSAKDWKYGQLWLRKNGEIWINPELLKAWEKNKNM